MEYAAASAWLKEQFHQNNFSGHLASGRTHAVLLPVDTCASGAEILISFPGYKAKNQNGTITYDYRVDLKKEAITTSLSHANLIVDLYNKCCFGEMSTANLRSALLTAAEEGSFEYGQTAGLLSYHPVVPTLDLLNLVQAAHGGKSYNRTGNRFDLTVEEVFKSIKWIVIQEDINYPIARGYEGRKMPFARYLEAVFASEKDRGNRLAEVIERALFHSRPPRWPVVDYSPLDRIR